MLRYFVPIIIFASITTLLWLGIFLFLPPVSAILIGLFITFGGLALAAWGALGIYYLHRFWGPKDSPRVILRASLRQGFFLSLGIVAFMLLQLFGATNVVSLGLVLFLILMMERLT